MLKFPLIYSVARMSYQAISSSTKGSTISLVFSTRSIILLLYQSYWCGHGLMSCDQRTLNGLPIFLLCYIYLTYIYGTWRVCGIINPEPQGTYRSNFLFFCVMLFGFVYYESIMIEKFILILYLIPMRQVCSNKPGIYLTKIIILYTL